MKKLLQYLKEKLWFPELKLGLAIALNLVIIGLISIYIDEVCKSPFKPIILLFIFISIILLYISLIWTNYERKRFSLITVPHERQCEEGSFRALIVALSKNSITDVIVESASDGDNQAGIKNFLYIQIKIKTVKGIIRHPSELSISLIN
ncbi:MAG: hypothetical protein EVG15_01010 [Candidatus Acididesulfobacter diazotrophicus]|jgi:hypothetical protein|uniref:Uncharacterized protein n=1 Tax=Candidatus Acididesulfobacter diazotrophicus TaxID=2597226 RepID=A0A519BQE0_9DELT|nr:MAG: hypothetical protein EVG15_01010 [Candidatus Acididesulfobacter diazotrophicus]